MHGAYSPGMLLPLRSLLCVIEEGGVNRAARRMGTTQPTITRHIQSLEQEFGAPLFERGTTGMRPTDLGFFVRDRFAPLLRELDAAQADVVTFAHGQHGQLRVGYIGLAAARFLNPHLAQLKREFPAVRLTLLDLTPGEQLQALRAGRLDVALAGQDVAAAAEDFYQRRVAVLRVCALLSADHPLAARAEIALAELRGQRVVGVAEKVLPGRNAWIARLCAKAGFTAKFAAQTENISETFAHVASGDAFALLPDYMEGKPPPGIVRVVLSDAWARWSLTVLRQRGRSQPAARRLIELIGASQT